MSFLFWIFNFFMLLVASAGRETLNTTGWVIVLFVWVFGAWWLHRERRQAKGRRRTQGRRTSPTDPRDDPDYDGYYDDVEIILRVRGVRPAGKWRRATSDWFHVSGVMHHAADAEAFIRGVQAAHDAGRDFGLTVEQEPDNAYDPKAISVFGWWDSGAREPRSAKIGYLPRELAAEVKGATPLAGELESVWLKPIDDKRDGLSVRMFLLKR